MIIRSLLLIAALNQLTACVAIPRVEVMERMEFNYAAPNPKMLTAEELLCCNQCQA